MASVILSILCIFIILYASQYKSISRPSRSSVVFQNPALNQDSATIYQKYFFTSATTLPPYLNHYIYIPTAGNGYVQLNGNGKVLSVIEHPEINNYYLSAFYNGKIYGSVNIYDNTTIRMFSMNTDGSDFTILCQDQPYRPMYENQFFYYLNADDSYQLYRISIDGTNKTKLSPANILSYEILDGYIYYTATNHHIPEDLNNYLHRINLDGSQDILLADCGRQLPVDFSTSGNFIYYTDISRNSQTRRQTFKVHKNGGQPEPVEKSSTTYPYFENTSIDGAIFYFDFNQKSIIQKSLENQRETVIVASDFAKFYIFDHYLYYITTKKNPVSNRFSTALCRFNLENEENKVLYRDVGYSFFMFTAND